MQSNIPPPFQHKWTEDQVFILLHKIYCSPPLQQLFFLKLGDNSPESIRMEQHLCLDVLKDTDWMGWMIRDKRVCRDTSGGLVVKDQWPRGLRVVSRLFEGLHPLAEKIKLSLGPVKSSQSLRKGSAEHALWKKWQTQSKHTWYFKYVAIRITLSSRWIYQRPTWGDDQIGRDVESSLIASSIQNTKVIELDPKGNRQSSKVNPNLVPILSVRPRPRLDMDKILARVEGRPPTSTDSPWVQDTKHAPQNCPIVPNQPQSVTTPLDGHETHSRALSQDIYHSINYISVEPPMELHYSLVTSTDADTTLVHSSVSSDQHAQEKAQTRMHSEQDRLPISA
ncbi:hypothetical protein I302_101269 [Kwoniella bestiolae CBS 10118]|uniref:Uncharacterized protein n=1 Tax=Kwoniella bestiolae CBS 10118 TaxID=1296100 RepID=A0A1B9G7G4_9TREE|nr:hypothetical protein I302_04643 [Kwoniella bestiolae CBS 10118]OCF26952.1 hypothetical protein I302_04643 [Kwoniella bestiolae CBS 10118]